MSDARRAPTTPPQSRRTTGGSARPLSVLPPPPVPPAVGLRRPSGQSASAPPLAYTSTLRPNETAAEVGAAIPLWDVPTSALPADATDDAPAWRSGWLHSVRSWGPKQALSRLGSRGQKVAIGAAACLVLGAGAWIASAAYGGTSVDSELHAAARPALQAAVKQSADAARAKAPAEPVPAAEAEPEPAAAPSGNAIEGKPLDVTSLATSQQAAPEPAPAAQPKPAAARAAAAAAEAPAAAAAAPASGKAFDSAAAQRAADKAVGAAASCVDEGARVPGSITLTFGSNGKVKSAKLGRSLSNPELERCVVGAFRRASVPAFSGPDGSISKTFRLKG